MPSTGCGLDHYLMKPWDPPEELLFPVLDDLLDSWQATVVRPFEGIRVAARRGRPEPTPSRTSWPAADPLPVPRRGAGRDRRCHGRRLRDSASRWSSSRTARRSAHPDPANSPTKVGLNTEASQAFYDLIILGAGPAGLAAGVYGASEGLQDGRDRAGRSGAGGDQQPDRELPGVPSGISGADLARRAATQAQRLGAELITATEATSVRVEGPVKVVTLTDGSEISCQGAGGGDRDDVRRLSVPGYERFEGAGVYYGAAASEVSTYRDQDVFVVGGANSAGQAAMMFSKFCQEGDADRAGRRLSGRRCRST